MTTAREKEGTKYDRCRRIDALSGLIARFAQRPFRGETYHWKRHNARKRRIWTRLVLVLWELPVDLQAGLAGALVQRTLPALERRHPALTSMRDRLNPVWIREAVGGSKERWEALGCELNDLHEPLRKQTPIGGDEFLYSAACELSLALEPDAAPAVVTYHCVHAAMLAVAAERDEAWEVIDPEAAAYVREIHAKVEREGHVAMPLGPTSYRIPEAEPAGQARWFAGWEAAMAWLRSAHLEDHDKVKDRCGLAEAVRRSRTGKTRFS
jgi:hypothetical protein